MNPPQSDSIRDAVRRRLLELDWSQADLAREAGVNANTITAIIKYGRWPKDETREKIEKALGWPKGRIEELATIGERGVNVTEPIRQTDESPSASGDQPLVLAGWPPGTFEGMTDIEREEWIARTKAAGLQIARELREGKQQ
jgi:transcriptional regulator with XRE-family HTH domain